MTPTSSNAAPLQQLPQGLRSAFDVVSYKGVTGNKTWVLRDLQSQLNYQLEPATIQGWEIPPANAAHDSGPSIIVTAVSHL